PKQAGDPYPEKDLAGVGLSYKLAQALVSQMKAHQALPSGYVAPEECLDLVAVGTVADLAPLTGENRALVRAGLKCIREPKREGILSLIQVSGLKYNRISATDIGFILGPRLNAAGRLESALAAFQLLSTHDVFEAGMLAQRLDDQNRERQQITREIQALAEKIALGEDPNALLIFAADPSFNSGVVGLAASRLSELYYRPAIVAQRGETSTRASCRSIIEFHITEALDQCADLLERYGGHAAAAGFTVKNENLPALIARLNQIAQNQLAALDLRPTLPADIEVPLSELNAEMIRYLDWLQPTGYGNPQAVFVSRNLKVRQARTVGKDSAHLKLTVTDGYLTNEAIAFRQGHWYNRLPAYIDLMYTFEINEFNGQKSFQLNVRDLKASGTAD
ncbi:MAG: single-stranded-DNA-specific exonuclease RecJ, partial [Chloroflexota bacterium]